MDLSLATPDAHYRLSAYDALSITINQIRYQESLILMSDRLEPSFPLKTLSELTELVCAPLLAWRPEIVIIATDLNPTNPDPDIMKFWHEHHVGFELMKRGSACRTFNLLSFEGRRVMAIFLMTGDVTGSF